MNPGNNHFNIIIMVCVIVMASACSGVRPKQDSQTPKKDTVMVSRQPFGNVDGKEVFLYTLANEKGVILKITNFGGIVTSIIVPDRKGKMEDIALGFDSLQPYLKGHPYFGAIVGRCGNRIANGRFMLDGVTYQLARNNGGNHLHGGIKGFDKVVWDSKEFNEEKEAGIELTYLSADGEEGYPGNLHVTVKYSLTSANEMKIEYTATTDKPTPVNLTHHSYFNLKGAGNGDIMDHIMMIDADRYTIVNEDLIPTGELRDVTGTPMDFRKPKTIGKDFNQVKGGYDHNFALNNRGKMAKVAEVIEHASGRIMDVYTSEPGLQFYSGNFLDGSLTGKGGKPYNQHYGFCLETQHFPDSPNQPSFPSIILNPGQVYHYTTIYRFTTE
jgi:aldose 1-epimerase